MRGDGDRAVRAFLRRYGPTLLLTAALFWLTYTVVFNFRAGDSDYFDHLSWAVRLLGPEIRASFYNGQEMLWHVCVHMTIAAGVTNIWQAAALVTAAANAAAYLIVCLFWERALPEKLPRWLSACVFVCVFLVSSLTLPGLGFYGGRGAVNTWHNPTNIMVRPFAAAVFFMTVNIYHRRRFGRHAVLVEAAAGEGRFAFADGFWQEFRTPVFTRWELLLYPLCLYLSACAKPSFLQVFAPAIFLFCLVDLVRTKGRLLPFCVKLALAFLPAAVILLRQYDLFFGGFSFAQPAPAPAETAAAAGSAAAAADAVAAADAAEPGLLIYFISPSFSGLGDFLARTWSALVPVLYPCAFPFFILLIAGRRQGNGAGWLGLLCLAVSVGEMLCFHETGHRAAHGNFSWGYYLAAWLLWSAAAGVYARLLTEKSRAGALARWGGSALLAWHLVCGLLYIDRILRTAQYYF